MANRLRTVFTGAMFGASLALSALPSWGQSGAQGAWTVAAQTTTQRTEVAVTAVNGKIYVLGGKRLGARIYPCFRNSIPQRANGAISRQCQRAPRISALLP